MLQLNDLFVCSDVTGQRVDANVVNLLLEQLFVTLQSVRLCAQALKQMTSHIISMYIHVPVHVAEQQQLHVVSLM